MFAACKNGQIATARLLIENGADVSKRDSEGQNLLHRAAAAPTENLEIIQLLIDHGLDPSSGTSVANSSAVFEGSGRVALFYAALHGRMEMFRFLQTISPPTGELALILFFSGSLLLTNAMSPLRRIWHHLMVEQ